MNYIYVLVLCRYALRKYHDVCVIEFKREENVFVITKEENNDDANDGSTASIET